MRRVIALGACLLALGFAASGCSEGDDDEDGLGGPGSGWPPAAMLGTWTFQSVTQDGAPANLSDVLDWAAGAVAAEMNVQENGTFVYQEVNGSGGQLWFESGFIFVDGTELDINTLMDGDGDASETVRYGWTLSSGVLTLDRLGAAPATVFTLTM